LIYGISEWRWNQDGDYFTLVDHIPSMYVTDLLGIPSDALWNSNQEIEAVIRIQDGVYLFDVAGTMTGSVGFDGDGPYEVILCANTLFPQGAGNGNQEIPEFGSIAAGIALVGAIAGFFIFRKRNQL